MASQLGALSLGASPVAGGKGLNKRASLTFHREDLQSPSVASSCFLEGSLVALVAAPASLTAAPDVAAAFSAILTASGGTPRGMMEERRCYGLATAHLPVFAEPVGAPHGDMAATTLFSEAALRTVAWSFAPGCKPELHVRARVGAPGQPTFRPAYNGELKTAGDGRALEQAAYYTAMDMVRVFFPASDAGPCARRFFSRPPVGFALVGFPHVAYYIALEWVGRLLVSPVSAPFFVGSAAHAAAAAALPDVQYPEPPRTIDATLWWVTPAEGAARDRTAWVVADGVFQKLVRGDARSGDAFAAMHAAYARLGKVLPTAPPRVHLVTSARLLYGAHEVLVELPAVAGREAADEEVTRTGGLLDAVAATVAWLARRRLVYTDLRGPNVLVDAEGAPWLVDFDDCMAVPQAVETVGGFRAVLAATAGAAVGGTFATRYCAGGLSEVEEAMAAAFEAAARA
jgi:hypothetical protein